MLGVRLDAETERGLEQLSRRSRRSKSDIAREAIRRFVMRQDAQLIAEAKRQSLRAAARGWSAEDEAWSAIAAAEDDSRPGPVA
jgi:RHH-type transcriptional regulator, rel operon repressor / antitoxin RelB